MLSTRKRKLFVAIALVLSVAGIVSLASYFTRDQPAAAQEPFRYQLNSQGNVESGLWSDRTAAQWLRSVGVLSQNGNTFNLGITRPTLQAPIPVSLAYYATDTPLNVMAVPAKTTTIEYTGREPKTIGFPSDTVLMCKYVMVVYVGQEGLMASEVPEKQASGSFDSPPGRVLMAIDQSSDVGFAPGCVTRNVVSGTQSN